MRIATLATMTAAALFAFTPAHANPGAGEKAETFDRGADMDMPRTEQQAQTDRTQTGTSEKIKAVQLGQERRQLDIARRNTVEEIIGKELQDDQGETLASVQDIIIDSGGNAEKVVLSQGGFLGLGAERMALDYEQVMQRGEEGDAMRTIAETTMQEAQPYSEEPGADPNAYTMPRTSVSLEKVMGSEVRGPRGEQVATAENIELKNGQAKHVILDVDGQKVAAVFAELQLVRDDDDYHFALTEDQMSQLNRIAGVSPEAQPGMEMEMEMDMDTEWQDQPEMQTEEY